MHVGQPSWQRLLHQAFSDSKLPETQQQRCDFFSIYHYIQQALALAGITNRSPFSWRKIILIFFKASGDPAEVRRLCLQAVEQLERPGSFRFNQFPIWLPILLGFALLIFILPQSTKTSQWVEEFKQQSLIILPGLDHENHQIWWPLSEPQDDQPSSRSDRHEKPIGLHNNSEWLMAQNPDAFTLQLYSAHQLEALHWYCDQFDICTDSAYYAVSINQQTLFRLVHGIFLSPTEVNTRKQQLAEEVRQQAPWMRRIGQIQQEIKNEQTNDAEMPASPIAEESVE